MEISRVFRSGVLLLSVVLLDSAARAQYAAERVGEVVQLTDEARHTVVSIAPSLGDLVFEMKVNGQNVLHFPYASLEEFKAHPGLAGIPFLGPWANRLDEQGFYANGKKYTFNMGLGNIQGTATPIHGFLTRASDWQVLEMKADHNSAWLTCRLDFYKHPDWMAQFPFAHTIEITQRLHDGVLEVHTRLDNLSTDPMPVAIGFHPYYNLTDSKREDWTIQVGAREHYLLQPNKIPSGETEPITKQFPDPKAVPLKDYSLDDVYGDLVRDDKGRATFGVTDGHQRIQVQFGPRFQSAVIFSPKPGGGAPPAAAPVGGAAAANPAPARPPQDPNYVCFEPMASITDALNLEHEGKFSGVQTIPPGGTWEESFWVAPSGF